MQQYVVTCRIVSYCGLGRNLYIIGYIMRFAFLFFFSSKVDNQLRNIWSDIDECILRVVENLNVRMNVEMNCGCILFFTDKGFFHENI